MSGTGGAVASDGLPASGEPARSAWFALAVLIGVSLFSFVDRQIITLAGDPLRRSLHFTDVELGAVQGLGLALFAGIASYPVAWLADRFDRRMILCGCILIWSLATAACGFATDFQSLMVCVTLIAVGEAGVVPIIWATIPDIIAPRHRTRANFIFFAAALLGAAAGLALGGAALGWLSRNMGRLPGWMAQMEPWRAAMIAVALPGPLFLLLVATLRLGRSHAVRGSASAGSGFLDYARRHRAVLLGIFGSVAAYNVSLGSTILFIPTALPRLFDITPAVIGLQLGGVLAVATVAGLGGSAAALRCWRGDRSVAPLRLARGLFIAAVLPTMFLPFVTAPWQVFAIAGVELFAAVGAASVLPGVLQDISPPHMRGRVIALSSIITALSQGFTPVVIGMISETIHSPRGLMIGIGAVALPGWLVAAVAMWRAEKPFLRARALQGRIG
jgi:MFS family permease